MAVKDYYLILGLEAGADVTAIKKAFRKLAMQYHPDKTGSTRENDLHYRELQEAYQTLSDPYKREQYLYSRWLERSMGKGLDHAITPTEIIQLFLKAEQYLSGTDHFRTNRKLLVHQVVHTFSRQRLDIIAVTNDQSMIDTVASTALKLCNRFNAEQIRTLQTHFECILSKSEKILHQWDELLLARQRMEEREQWKFPVLILITILLCIAIYWASR